MGTEKNIENPKIYAAIAGVIADVGSVAKDKVNKQQGFKYRSVDDVFNALHPALAKNKVFIVPKILERNCEVAGETRSGARMIKVVCKIKFNFYAEDGSYVESIIFGEGLDTGDKATNKAMAIAYKYACFQVFCIPTEDMTDPDAERPELAEDSQPKRSSGKEESKKSTERKTSDQHKEKDGSEEQEGSDENAKMTEAMLNTIRAEQKRTGVEDAVILARKAIKAKKIEDMTVAEFKIVMDIFKKTPDLKRGGADE